jgi:hypothetical protein
LISFFQWIILAPMTFEVEVEVHERIKRLGAGRI